MKPQRPHTEQDTAPYHAILNAAQAELERQYMADDETAEHIAKCIRTEHRNNPALSSDQIVSLLEDEI